MQAQAASTSRASACRDAGLSGVRRAEAVHTTTVANTEENSTLGADAMHATLPLKKASSPGRGRQDATPCVCVEYEGVAAAPAAHGETDCARVLCAHSAATDPSHAAFVACSISSSKPRRRASIRNDVWLEFSSARWARAPQMPHPRGRHGRPDLGCFGGDGQSSA